MKKIMAALFVTMCVMLGIGMGPKEALADGRSMLAENVISRMEKADVARFREEIESVEAAFERLYDVNGYDVDVNVSRFTHNGMNDCSFVVSFVMPDGSVEGQLCAHNTHEDLEEGVAILDSYCETMRLADWM